MKLKHIAFLAVSILVFMSFTNSSMAEVKGKRYRWTDRKRDDTADKNETTIEGSQEKMHKHYWKTRRWKVDTQLERKYDKDKDGLLKQDEAREYLRDKYSLIKRGGKAAVDSEFEKSYDLNEDGAISPAEAEEMKKEVEF